MTEPAPRLNISCEARLIGDTSGSGADSDGGASEGEAERDDGEGDQGVQDAVQLDRHFVVPFLRSGGSVRIAVSMWTMLR